MATADARDSSEGPGELRSSSGSSSDDDDLAVAAARFLDGGMPVHFSGAGDADDDDVELEVHDAAGYEGDEGDRVKLRTWEAYKQELDELGLRGRAPAVGEWVFRQGWDEVAAAPRQQHGRVALTQFVAGEVVCFRDGCSDNESDENSDGETFRVEAGAAVTVVKDDGMGY
eukprot:gene3583-2152_t